MQQSKMYNGLLEVSFRLFHVEGYTVPKEDLDSCLSQAKDLPYAILWIENYYGTVIYKTQNTYAIPEENLQDFVAKFEKLQRKAQTLGVDTPAYAEVGTYLQKIPIRKNHEWVDSGARRLWHHIAVIGLAPSLQGWIMLGVIDSSDVAVSGYMLRVAPGQTIPEAYRDTEKVDPYKCDHCGHNRRRVETFLVQNEATGEVAQVGRQCLKDYLGFNLSPESLASYFGYLSDLSEDLKGMDEFESRGGGGYHLVWEMPLFLTHAASAIRRDGWTSGKVAREKGIQSTSSRVIWSLLPPRGTDEDVALWHKWQEEVLDEDKELAQKVMDWTPSLWAQDQDKDSDYVFNIKASFPAGIVSSKTSGLITSLIAVYKREQEKIAKVKIEKEITGNSNWIGNIGEKITIKARITHISARDNMYGTQTLLKFITAAGDVLTWWKSGYVEEKEVGAELLISGKIKKHSEFRDVKETTLERCCLTDANKLMFKLSTMNFEKVKEVIPWPNELYTPGCDLYIPLEQVADIVEKLGANKATKTVAKKIQAQYNDQIQEQS